jgi:hypothetical protein
MGRVATQVATHGCNPGLYREIGNGEYLKSIAYGSNGSCLRSFSSSFSSVFRVVRAKVPPLASSMYSSSSIRRSPTEDEGENRDITLYSYGDLSPGPAPHRACVPEGQPNTAARSIPKNLPLMNCSALASDIVSLNLEAPFSTIVARRGRGRCRQTSGFRSWTVPWSPRPE